MGKSCPEFTIFALKYWLEKHHLESTNNSKTIHTLGIRKNDSSQEIATFWVINPIEYTKLKFDVYKSGIVRVNCEEQVLDELREFLYSPDIFGKD